MICSRKHSLFHLLIFSLATYGLASTVRAQPLIDSTLTWHSYAKVGVTKYQVYPNPKNKKRTKTIVLTELANNQGPSTISDLPFLAEEIGRTIGIDPVQVVWVVHWGAFSYRDAKKSPKEIFIQATFNRTASSQLSSPSWRIVTREQVEEITDRLVVFGAK